MKTFNNEYFNVTLDNSTYPIVITLVDKFLNVTEIEKTCSTSEANKIYSLLVDQAIQGNEYYSIEGNRLELLKELGIGYQNIA